MKRRHSIAGTLLFEIATLVAIGGVMARIACRSLLRYPLSPFRSPMSDCLTDRSRRARTSAVEVLVEFRAGSLPGQFPQGGRP